MTGNVMAAGRPTEGAGALAPDVLEGRGLGLGEG